jgi:glycine/D-amino acid oxidase-like deaminating enzyme
VTTVTATPGSPEVVVVGCGAQGLSVALHLAQRGVRVVAVDREPPGSQTSSRAAGQSVLAQTEPGMGALMHRTIRQLVGFEDATGVPLQVHQVGSVKLALSDWAASQLEREVARATAIGARVTMVDPVAAGELAPHIDTAGVVAAWHSPEDCYWAPPAMLAAFHRAALEAGATFRTGPDVRTVAHGGGRVTGVETSDGPIAANAVIVTAGAWTAQLLERSGLGALPICFVRHQYSIRGPVPGVHPGLPSVRVVDHAVYARPEGENLMFGTYEPHPAEFDAAALPQRVGDVALDRTPADEALAQVADVFPGVVGAPLVEMRGGAIAMTPDRAYLIDEAPAARGLYFSTGDSVMGLSVAPALGEDLANWILSGDRPPSLAGFRADRFDGELSAVETRRRALAAYEAMYRDDLSRGEVRRSRPAG